MMEELRIAFVTARLMRDKRPWLTDDQIEEYECEGVHVPVCMRMTSDGVIVHRYFDGRRRHPPPSHNHAQILIDVMMRGNHHFLEHYRERCWEESFDICDGLPQLTSHQREYIISRGWYKVIAHEPDNDLNNTARAFLNSTDTVDDAEHYVHTCDELVTAALTHGSTRALEILRRDHYKNNLFMLTRDQRNRVMSIIHRQ